MGGECRACAGSGKSVCLSCDTSPELGVARPLCTTCAASRVQKTERPRPQRAFKEESGPPPAGVSITKCTAGDVTRLKELWSSRQADGEVVAAWKVDNPLLTYKFQERRKELKRMLGREPEFIEGFHGSSPGNYLSIVDSGFREDLRGTAVGQVYGRGEYMACNPNVSVGYCRGGEYMLVCRLTLGEESSTPDNNDGDHIWVPSAKYYVIARASQILPQYLIKFSSSRGYGYGGSTQCPKLEKALASGYSTKPAPRMVPVPEQRPCVMKRPFATVLWMGFLHGHFEDDALKLDVTRFFERHAAEYTEGMKIQIVKGHFKKAHAILEQPIPRELVHKLNSEPFIERGTRRTICVEDAHGSPGAKCPRYIAGYCRGQNLRHTHPCFCSHPPRTTANAKYRLDPLDLNGAKATEIMEKFMASAPFHTGQPRIVGIKAIKNDVLSRCHEEYRKYLTTKHGEEPAVQELYHGTNNNITDVLYTHGLQPPSDCNASDACPVSGGKGLCTTLCDNTCPHCTEKHEWKRCHMYGLGIYLADMAQKSHRYCSQPQIRNGRQVYRMIICSVLGKSFQIEGHLKDGQCMHDVVNVRALDEELLDEYIEPTKATKVSHGIGASIMGSLGDLWGRVVAEEHDCWRLHTGRMAKKDTEGLKWNWVTEKEEFFQEATAEKCDLLFVKGLLGNCRPGYSVVNSEYIAFHPHQCLPKYEIEYEI